MPERPLRSGASCRIYASAIREVAANPTPSAGFHAPGAPLSLVAHPCGSSVINAAAVTAADGDEVRLGLLRASARK
jgi:hypothetical protein